MPRARTSRACGATLVVREEKAGAADPGGRPSVRSADQRFGLGYQGGVRDLTLSIRRTIRAIGPTCSFHKSTAGRYGANAGWSQYDDSNHATVIAGLAGIRGEAERCFVASRAAISASPPYPRKSSDTIGVSDFAAALADDLSKGAFSSPIRRCGKPSAEELVISRAGSGHVHRFWHHPRSPSYRIPISQLHRILAQMARLQIVSRAHPLKSKPTASQGDSALPRRPVN